MEINPFDLILMVGGRKSKFIKDNQGLYKDCVISVFAKHALDNEGWNKLVNQYTNHNASYEYILFSGVAMPKIIYLSFKIKAYYTDLALNKVITNLTKDAENLARDILGVPRIGQGWISETTLFKLIEYNFPQLNIIQHGSPAWLGRQHFDIWIPDIKIAIEYHGLQHFEPIEFFGGKEAFDKTVERDIRKANLAKKNGVKLLVVKESDDSSIVVGFLTSFLEKRKVTIK